MKRHEPDPLLNELLGGEEVADFRQATLDRTLDALRRRRRRRHLYSLGAVAALPVVLALAIYLARPSHPAPGRRMEAAVNPASVQPPAPPIKHISDEELFALFPNRPMVLIGAPGEQRLVFLDAPRKKDVRGM